MLKATPERIFFAYANFKKDTELKLINKSDHFSVVGSRR